MAEKMIFGKGPVRPLKEEEASREGKEAGEGQSEARKGQEASGKVHEASGKVHEATNPRRKTRPADPSRHGFPSGFSLPKKKLIPVTPQQDASAPPSTPDHDD